MRVWDQAVGPILAADLSVTPLAPIAKVERGGVPSVLLAMSKRFMREVTTERAATLWSATQFLLAARYGQEAARDFVRGVRHMLYGIRGIEETPMYLDILGKGKDLGCAEGESRGRIAEAREFLVLQGRKRFGPPDGKPSPNPLSGGSGSFRG